MVIMLHWVVVRFHFFMIRWGWFMIGWCRFMVCRFGLMVGWFGLMVAINWMCQVVTVMHHVGHVWVLLHVVHGHPQGKNLFQGEGMALV